MHIVQEILRCLINGGPETDFLGKGDVRCERGKLGRESKYILRIPKYKQEISQLKGVVG